LYASANVFVFPNAANTFGLVLVLLESMATGTPVACFPVDGPLEVIGGSAAGMISHDLEKATKGVLKIPRAQARQRAKSFSWETAAKYFTDYLIPLK